MSVVPCFAVIGHPNEGKSSVVSTLAENDRIRISPVPGETVASREYPVEIDGSVVMRFVDTPGFQNPLQTLGWLRKYTGPPERLFTDFLAEFRHDPGMAHECELLRPVAEGAGIIYVLDASRPLRRVDMAEMEVLRLSGRPRMAVLNCKTGEAGFVAEWKRELRKHFHLVRVFNALRATFAERVRLLESLRVLEQDWEQALHRVVEAFRRDWERRNRDCAGLACDFLRRVLTLSENAALSSRSRRKEIEDRLASRLENRIRDEELRLHGLVCAQFRHDALAFELPAQSLLRQDLFSQSTWRVFGLSRSQLATAAMAAGGVAGAVVDMAVLGHSLGLFAALGGAAAGVATLVRGEHLAARRMFGFSLGKRLVHVGPVNTVQWIYILLDRFLLHYWYVTHWAHARRDQPDVSMEEKQTAGLELTTSWDRSARTLCAEYFSALSGRDAALTDTLEQDLRRVLEKELERISLC